MKCKRISLSQLRRIIKTFKTDRRFKVDVKTMDVVTLFRYAAYTFLKEQIVRITGNWSTRINHLTRDLRS